MIIVVIFVLMLTAVVAGMFFFASGRNASGVALLISSIASLLLIVVVCTAFHCGSQGGGQSLGTVVNVAHEGLWWTPAKVYFLHRGEVKADEFGIEPALVDAAGDAAEAGVLVRVTYTSSVICGAWNYADCDVIHKLEVVPPAGPTAPPPVEASP